MASANQPNQPILVIKRSHTEAFSPSKCVKIWREAQIKKVVTEANAALQERKQITDEQNACTTKKCLLRAHNMLGLHAKIESLQIDFNQMKENWQSAEHEILNKTETIKSQIELGTTLNNNLEQTCNKLATTENIIEKKDSEILMLNKLLQAEKKEQKSKEAEIATLKVNLNKFQETEISLREDQKTKEADIFHLKANIDTLLQAEKKEQKSKEAEIATLKANLNNLQKTEIGLRDDQKTKEADIVQLKASIDTLTKDLDLAKTTFVWEDHDCKCAVKGAVDENLTKEVENLKKKLKLRESDVSLLQEEIKIRNKQIELRTQEIQQLNEQLSQCKETM
jgi:chromosome segregation ATPase